MACAGCRAKRGERGGQGAGAGVQAGRPSLRVCNKLCPQVPARMSVGGSDWCQLCPQRQASDGCRHGRKHRRRHARSQLLAAAAAAAAAQGSMSTRARQEAPPAPHLHIIQADDVVLAGGGQQAGAGVVAGAPHGRAHPDLRPQRAPPEVPHADEAVGARAGHQAVAAVCGGGGRRVWRAGVGGGRVGAGSEAAAGVATAPPGHARAGTRARCRGSPHQRRRAPVQTARTGPSCAVRPGEASSSLGAGTPGADRLIASASAAGSRQYAPRCMPLCMLYLSSRPASPPTSPKLPQRERATAVAGASGAPASCLGGGKSTHSPRAYEARRQT